MPDEMGLSQKVHAIRVSKRARFMPRGKKRRDTRSSREGVRVARPSHTGMCTTTPVMRRSMRYQVGEEPVRGNERSSRIDSLAPYSLVDACAARLYAPTPLHSWSLHLSHWHVLVSPVCLCVAPASTDGWRPREKCQQTSACRATRPQWGPRTEQRVASACARRGGEAGEGSCRAQREERLASPTPPRVIDHRSRPQLQNLSETVSCSNVGHRPTTRY